MKVVSQFATINATLIFSPNQAYMAAAAGAYYVSPFVARLDAIGQDGMQVVRDTVKIFQNYTWEKEVVAASIRNSMHVHECLMAGSHIVTMPFATLKGLMDHPLTDIGLQMFLNDWAKVAPKLEAQPVAK
jgi:transaldolase